MPRTLFNEGRVVGYSAYEIYVRHALASDPSTEPASESEWLASTLGLGSSMLLKIEPDTLPLSSDIHSLEFELPTSSRLCGASTIIGSLFIGSGDDSTWSQKVEDYGELISNTSTSSPTSSTIPMKSLTNIAASMADQISDYVKIMDGVVIQGGTWSDNSDDPPEKTLSPDFSKRAKVRLQVKGAITTGFYMLLSGFTDSGVIYGVSDTSGTPQNPQNGNFLGPAAFPWAAKIILTIPTVALSMAGAASYTRAFPSDSSGILVDYAPIIDFKNADITQYYGNDDAAVTVDISTLETSRPGISILASRAVSGTVDGVSVTIPPDLLGGTATFADECKFGPIASYSPYSVHMFNGENSDKKAMLLESSCHGSIGLIRDDESLVVGEIDKITDPEAPSVVSVSDNYVINRNALQFYNSTYMYFYKNAAGGGIATAEDLQNVSTFATQQQIYGYVSDQFLQDECLSYSEMNSMFGTSGTALWMVNSLNLTMFNQLKSEGDKYKYFLASVQGSGARKVGPTQQMHFIPVESATGKISVMMSVVQQIMSQSDTAISIDFTGKYEYLGSWWNGTVSQTDEKLATSGLIEDHPMVRVGIPTSDVYYQPNALTPKAPAAKYGYYYYDWYNTVTIGSMIGDANWQSTGIHESLKTMSIRKFLEYSVNHWVGAQYGSSAAEGKTSNILNVNRFIFGRSAVLATANGGYTTVDSNTVFNVPLESDLNFRAHISKNEIYVPAEIHFYEVTWDNETPTISTDDSTLEYVDQFRSQWSAVSVSGLHKTVTISLSDDLGSPLPLLGADATLISNDYIIWQDLLDGLSTNKKVDILGSLKGLKDAMSNAGLSTGVPYAIQFNADGSISLIPISS